MVTLVSINLFNSFVTLKPIPFPWDSGFTQRSVKIQKIQSSQTTVPMSAGYPSTVASTIYIVFFFFFNLYLRICFQTNGFDHF